jgi:TatD DNase family protein
VRNPDTLVRGCAVGRADRSVRVTHTGCAASTSTCVTRTLLSGAALLWFHGFRWETRARFLHIVRMFYDTHAHLDYPDFAQDLAQVLERARAAGITRFFSIGTDLESSARAIQLSEQYSDVFASVGWHPSDAARAPGDVRPGLRELALHPKVVAIGETGLDYHRLPSKKAGGTQAADELYKKKQEECFRQQLELAAELGLNCVVHQRDCFEETLAVMREFAGRVRGVFHCFVNSPADVQRVLEIGSMVSFTGVLTFKNAQTVRDALKAAPLEQFMLETDAPFLAPAPFRGKRSEPAHVKEIAATAAEVKAISLAELSRATCAAAEAFFVRRQM